MSVSVVLASVGRKIALIDVLKDLSEQTLAISQVVISTPKAEDAPELAAIPEALRPAVTYVTGVLGNSAQRNAGCHALRPTDYIAFFDDDSRVHREYLEQAVGFLQSVRDAAGLEGVVIKDGAAIGREVSSAEATSLLHDFLDSDRNVTSVVKLYGCNFVVRSSLIADLSFDERLPLYGWLEDLDYSRQLLKRGRLFRLHSAAIVHRGISSGGRKAHRRFGYSQVANPVYLRSKGSISWRELTVFLIKGLPNNAVASAIGPDRRGHYRRVCGNLIAVRDFSVGRLDPARITELRLD